MTSFAIVLILVKILRILEPISCVESVCVLNQTVIQMMNFRTIFLTNLLISVNAPCFRLIWFPLPKQPQRTLLRADIWLYKVKFKNSSKSAIKIMIFRWIYHIQCAWKMKILKKCLRTPLRMVKRCFGLVFILY